MPHKSFFLFPFLMLALIIPAGAVPLSFNDLNMVDRDISIYQINETGSTLIYQGASSNMTADLNNSYSYQIVLEPSRESWFDNPTNLITYMLDDGIGQSLTFALAILMFGGLIRLAVR